VSDHGNLKVDVRKQGSTAVVTPQGDVDMAGAPTLGVELRTTVGGIGKQGRVIVDLTHVPYMDSAGLATMVEAMKLSRRNEVRLVVMGLSPRVKALFEIAKLHQVMLIAETMEEAHAK
jgi:anti-sigma B factor antagonist